MLEVEMPSSPEADTSRNVLIRRVVAAVITGALFAVIVIGLAAAPPSQDDRVTALGQRIRCPVCQNEAIADSPSETARQMMEIVIEKVGLGESDEMIVDYFVARYGQWVLLDPPLSGWFLPLWALPVLVLGVGIVVIARRRRRAPSGIQAHSPPGTNPEVVQSLAQQDIDEVAGQVAAEEISQELAKGLTAKYQAEKDEAARSGSKSGNNREQTARSRARLWTGWGVGILAMGVVVVMVVQSIEVRGGDPAGGQRSLDEVTNEELEQVVAENPDIAPMRLALADRYFAESNYEAAIPHYLEVLRQDPQQSSAWGRLGWSVYQFGDVDLAFEYVRRSLEIDPSVSESQLYLGAIYLYGYADPSAALPLLEAVAIREDLPSNTRLAVEEAIAEARSALDE